MIEDMKYHLKNNPNDIIKILEYYKFKNIKKNGNEIRCAKPNGDNASTIRIKINDNHTILDFTMGSGSTGVACMNTNRKFIGIEIDEKYFNIAKDRIEKCKKD